MHIDTGQGQFLWRSLQCPVFGHFVCWTFESESSSHSLLNFMFDDQSYALFDTQLEHVLAPHIYP